MKKKKRLIVFCALPVCAFFVMAGSRSKPIVAAGNNSYSTNDYHVPWHKGLTMADVLGTHGRHFADATVSIQVRRRDTSLFGLSKEHFSESILSAWEETGEKSDFLLNAYLRFSPKRTMFQLGFPMSEVEKQTLILPDDDIDIMTSKGGTVLRILPR